MDQAIGYGNVVILGVVSGRSTRSKDQVRRRGGAVADIAVVNGVVAVAQWQTGCRGENDHTTGSASVYTSDGAKTQGIEPGAVDELKGISGQRSIFDGQLRKTYTTGAPIKGDVAGAVNVNRARCIGAGDRKRHCTGLRTDRDPANVRTCGT